MKKLFLLLSFISIFYSCKKDPLVSDDYFAFGNGYGHCASNCTNMYLIDKDKIYPDNMDHLYGKLIFNSTPLPSSKFDLAIHLKNNFPKYLRDHPDTTYGCPDCVDQGKIYIEIKEKGKIMHWNIDPFKNNQPIEIRSYIQNMEDVLEELEK